MDSYGYQFKNMLSSVDFIGFCNYCKSPLARMAVPI